MEAISDKTATGITYAGVYFKLVNDLTLPADRKPIGALKAGKTSANSGRDMNPFSGIIDGNNHTLTFAKGSRPLLGYSRDAVLNNINIKGAYINGNGVLENYVVDYGPNGSNENNEGDDPKATLTCNNLTIKEGTIIKGSGITTGWASGIDYIDLNGCIIEKGVKIGCNEDGSSAEASDVGSFVGATNARISNCVSSADVYGVNNIGGIAGIRGQSMSDFYGKDNNPI